MSGFRLRDAGRRSARDGTGHPDRVAGFAGATPAPRRRAWVSVPVVSGTWGRADMAPPTLD
ncbi:MAG TPA: hypothetical protein VKP69_33835 [Isosphaeraceae bacterium]|nr:hypothetical protein [Isosphaeraceae bacterium]